MKYKALVLHHFDCVPVRDVLRGSGILYFRFRPRHRVTPGEILTSMVVLTTDYTIRAGAADGYPKALLQGDVQAQVGYQFLQLVSY